MSEHPRAVAGIQARLSSTRLPGKVLADVAGKPLIQRVFERVRAAKRVDAVYVLTSTEESDDPLAAFLDREGIPYRRGPLQDVLARYVALVDELEPAYVVRVTGDCPLVEPDFIDLQLEALAAFDGDLIEIAGGSKDVEGVLGGQGVFSTRALHGALASTDPRDREHVGSFWFRTHAADLRFVEVDVDPAFRDRAFRLTVDEKSDLELVRRIFDRHMGGSRDQNGLFGLRTVLEWLDEHPEVGALNEMVVESLDNRSLRGLERPKVNVVGHWP